VKAMAHFDVLRGRGHGLWRDVGVLDLPRIMRYHHIAYEVLTEACKRLAYDRWLVEVRTFIAFPCERLFFSLYIGLIRAQGIPKYKIGFGDSGCGSDATEKCIIRDLGSAMSVSCPHPSACLLAAWLPIFFSNT
jgi:hypothetical protein